MEENLDERQQSTGPTCSVNSTFNFSVGVAAIFASGAIIISAWRFFFH